jgi:hypothetical protein
VNFLAKLGKFIAEGVLVLSGLGPVVGQFFGSKSGAMVGTVVQDLTSIGGVVVMAEAMMGPGGGPLKLSAATPPVANIIKTSELVNGHKIINQALYLEGCTDITSGTAKVLNSLDGGVVQSSGQPITTEVTKP